jgi:IS6 family transposase
MLSKSRDTAAATRFFRKALGAAHTVAPRVSTVDKNPAYPKALSTLKDATFVPEDCELRQIKYLNHIVEQDHRFIKRWVKPGRGFYSFKTAWATLRGYEIMNMIRKGQIRNVAKGNILRQLEFIHQAFGLVA